ncbi:MAG: hypothetical protein IT377_13720 [Polyangiaceae bacterium]|nr:hypothetical protein [Polyangiaceae bacterium]
MRPRASIGRRLVLVLAVSWLGCAHGACFIPMGGDDEDPGPPSCTTSCEKLTKKTCYTTNVEKCIDECHTAEAKAQASSCETQWSELMACCSSCAGGGNACDYSQGCGPDEFSPCRRPCPAEWESVQQCTGT